MSPGEYRVRGFGLWVNREKKNTPTFSKHGASSMYRSWWGPVGTIVWKCSAASVGSLLMSVVISVLMF